MSGTNEPDWDLDEFKARIREQAAQMRERAAASVPLSQRGATAWTFNWLETKSHLKLASAHTHLDVPPVLPRYHGLKRTIALTASRVVLFLTRFILRRQTELNVCLLDAVREMGEALHSLETRVIQQQEQIRQLEATISQLQLRVSSTQAPARKAS
jgi:hypothetical protein